MRVLLLLFLAPACRTGPWDPLTDDPDGSARDLALPRPDLALPDLRPPDLTVPPWCAPGSELIYVVEDRTNMLARFDPAARTFTNVGRLSCPDTAGDEAFSMAVQRDGTAWVVFDSGRLFRVETRTATCQATTFDPQRQGVGGGFGMGFTAETPGGAAETLYIASDDRNMVPNFLGRLDLPNLRVFQVAPLLDRAELTGSSDGRLWGFFPDEDAQGGPRVAELDRANAREVSRLPVRIPGISRPGFAFARWAGDFWLFVYDDSTSTQVHRLRPDGTISAVLTNTGRSVVGAGVSICAP